MAMASWMLRGRLLCSGRSLRSRNDSEDEVQLDFSKDANENAREILSCICKKQGLTEWKRCSYLNAFVKLVTKLDVWSGGLGYSVEELQCCLRVALVHEASQVRAAALRAVRYLLKEEKDVRILNKLRYPCLISRSLDLILKNEAERVQALRLVRRMLVLAPIDFPMSLARSLISLANGAAEGKDRMLRSCLATLAEICVLNPEMFISCGGVSAVIRNLLECQMPRIAESLCGVLLFLLNNPATRSKAGICLQSLAAPYCDFHLNNDRNRDEREGQFHCSRLALLSVLRSWPGLLHFCHPANSSGLRSIVNVLYLKQLEVRKGILDLLYELLGLPQPEWTDEFSVALEAVDPSHPRDAWKLQEGFVSAEGRDILPHLARFRPNIVEIHLALLLYTFLQVGLLEAIVEVIVSSDTFISVRATVLLGELLHLIHNLLPPECCNLTPALPNLLSHASNASLPSVQHQALAAVAILSHLHAMLKRRPAPASLFLDRTLQGGGWGREESKAGRRSKLYTLVAPKEGDDLLKDSAVLTHKDGFCWNWNVVRAVLKSRSESLKKLEDSNHRTFLKRLVYYFKPSSNQFSRFELGNKKQTQMYTLAGLELIDCLLEVEEVEGGKLLNELLADIGNNIAAITSSKSAHDCLFSPQHVSNSVCQYYFMYIGRLCRCSKGLRVLDKAGIFEQLLDLVTSTNHDCYVKLVVSGLDYSMDGMPRVILSNVLTAPSESSRLYATQFLLVLLRARLPDFQKWGIELLVMQLYDQSKAVSLAAIAILGEATEEKVYLDAVISFRPSLLHLGDKGLLLLIRFLSTPNGFTFLQDANFVTTQLERWANNYNYRYVRLVEGDIHDSLTLHQCNEDGRYSRRVTSMKHYVRDVFIPPHLYGQLVQHEKGFQLLVKEGKLHNLFQCVHNGHCSSEQEILEVKAALWGCGHVATSPLGISFLREHGVVNAILHLAQRCPIYSVRGTALYTLGLVATTFEGANLLNRAGWFCVRHHRHDRWPVITDEEDEGNVTSSNAELLQQSGLNADGDGISCCSQVPSGWDSNCSSVTQERLPTVGDTQESNPGQFYIPDDEDDDDDVNSIGSGDDEGFHLEEAINSTKWSDMSGSNVDDSEQQRKSRTLPHPRHHSVPAAPFPHRHFRSLSECKQTQVQALPNATLVQAGEWALGPSRTRKDSSRSEQESKSRCNSCTDSSGVSSCESGLGPAGKHGGPHEQTLSPIPSSASLNTLRSGAVTEQTSRNQVTYRKLSSVYGSVTSSLTSDTSSCHLSQQDTLGYARLHCLHRYRRPLYADTVSLAAMELLVFDEHTHIPPSSHLSAVSRALKVRSLDRQYLHPGMCEFEASLPPQLLSGSSSISLAARTYIGSRSNLAAARHSGLVNEGSSMQQCYMGICLPQDLASLYPRDEPATRAADVKERGRLRGNSERRRSTSLGDMEDLQEAGEEDTDTSFSSDSEDLEGQMKTHHSAAAASDYHHSSTNCLACCRLRDRKISAGSYHRHRTDTESSYGGGESPVLFPRRRKSHSASSCLLGLTPGGSVESGNSTSLDIGPCHQRVHEEAGTPSKALIRREILKHVMRMSNPVWIKLSKQTLLQLKQQYPVVFQDVCLYSEVSHRMGTATYRLSARRFLQELFLDLHFEALYEEPAVILQIQQSVAESTGTAAIASPQNTGHSPASLATSPNLPSVSNNQDATDGLALNNLAQTYHNVTSMKRPVSPTGNPSEVTGVTNPCQEYFITAEEKPPVSENTGARFDVNTKTLPLDTVSLNKATVQQGVFPVKSPPLEVVTEEPMASATCLDTLSVADAYKSNLVVDHFPVKSNSEKLTTVSGLEIVSAASEISNSAQTVDSRHNLLLCSAATHSTTDPKNPGLSNSTQTHTLSSDVKHVPSAVVMTEQRVQGEGEEFIHSFIVSDHKKTNCEQSFVVTSKIREEAEAENCLVPNIAERVGSYDLLVTELKCQELGNLNLSTQQNWSVSQSLSGSAMSAVPSESIPVVSGVMFDSIFKRNGHKVPETKNKQHEGELGAQLQRNTPNYLPESASSCSDSLSTAAVRSPNSDSVLKESSTSLSTSSHISGAGDLSTESAVSSVKAVLGLPEQSVPHHSQFLMPSQCQPAATSAGAASLNRHSHTGASSSLGSSASVSQNKQALHTVLSEDLTSSFEMFPEMHSSKFTVNFPEKRIIPSMDSVTRSDPEYKHAKSQVPTKAAAIGTRQRKMATACPPNISSLTRTGTKTVPATTDSKTVQCPVIQMSQEESL